MQHVFELDGGCCIRDLQNHVMKVEYARPTLQFENPASAWPRQLKHIALYMGSQGFFDGGRAWDRFKPGAYADPWTNPFVVPFGKQLDGIAWNRPPPAAQTSRRFN